MAFVAIVAMVYSVLRYARTGVLRGDKFLLYVAVPDATNLLKGSEVWLNGQQVGTVTAIHFAPPTDSLYMRVVITTEVLTEMREAIRVDSRVELKSGGSVIGAPVVYLNAGTLRARGVVPGDTLRGAGISDFEIAASQVTEALTEVPAIMTDAKIILANTKSVGARLNGMMSADRGHGTLSAQTKSLMAKLTTGRGSAALLMRDPAIRRRVERSMASADTLRGLLASRMDEMGRFKRDSTLARSVRTLRDDIAELRVLAASPSGTVGRIAADSALIRSLDSVFVELTALMADIKKNPLRYSKVF